MSDQAAVMRIRNVVRDTLTKIGEVPDSLCKRFSETNFEEITFGDDDDNALLARVETAIVGNEAEALLLISDRLAYSGADNPAASALAAKIRGSWGECHTVIGLVAIVSRTCGRLNYIDKAVPANLGEDAFARSLNDALSAIGYKLPPQSRMPDEVITVRRVNTVDELRTCLRLRQEVYGLLGYCNNQVSGLELDYFDQSALHFIAEAGELRRVIGTARLVFTSARAQVDTVFGDTKTLRRFYAQLCDQLADQGGSSLAKRLMGMASGLPVFSSFDSGSILSLRSDEFGRFCEISRVVVAQNYRGFGIANLLVRACLAAAVDLDIPEVLLECIPQHVPLYAKFGFERLTAVRPARVRDLGQLAVVMRLALHNSPSNQAWQIAAKDIAMLRAPRTEAQVAQLCLCRSSHCWSDGDYPLKGKRDCPLKHEFVAT